MIKDSFSEKQPIDIGRPKKSLLVCLLDIKTEKPPQTHVTRPICTFRSPYRTQIFLLVNRLFFVGHASWLMALLNSSSGLLSYPHGRALHSQQAS